LVRQALQVLALVLPQQQVQPAQAQLVLVQQEPPVPELLLPVTVLPA
jgi:hypothetical protein